MKTVSRFAFLGLGIALLIAIAVISTNSVHGQGTHQPNGVTPYTHSQILGHQHAIQPNATKLQAHTAPSYTQADVEQYLQAHPLFPQKTAHTITFVPKSRVEQVMEENLPTNASDTVCFVEYQGVPTGIFQGPPSVPGATLPKGSKAHPRKPLTRFFMVFDGITGDLLVQGAH